MHNTEKRLVNSQPRGFSIFFLTEMWERYGFYVIQTLLVFYLIRQLHLSDEKSYVIVGSFTALAYINSIFGGIIADKLLGSVVTIVIGGVFLLLGYLVLGSVSIKGALTVGLALISIGTGLLKPNISNLLSILYPHDDIRKDSGYTIYYVGIYVGALGGSFLGGYIEKYFGWGATFLSSAIGIVIGIVTFYHGWKKFNLVDNRKPHLNLRKFLKAFFAILALFLMSCLVIHSEFLSMFYFICIAIFCLGFIIYAIVLHKGIQRQRLIAFLLLVMFSVCYWAIYFQQFFSLSLCTERCSGNLPVPASSVPSVESLALIALGPVISHIWFYCKNKNRNISIPIKFSLGFLCNSFCFMILLLGLWHASRNHLYLDLWIIIAAYIVMAIGELCLSPTSLSMVSSLVPKRFAGSMMGISLLSIGFGGKLAGLLAASSALSQSSHSLVSIQQWYFNAFLFYLIISLLTFFISIILAKYIKRLIVA